MYYHFIISSVSEEGVKIIFINPFIISTGFNLKKQICLSHTEYLVKESIRDELAQNHFLEEDLHWAGMAGYYIAARDIRSSP